MTTETLTNMSDQQLAQLISTAQGLLEARLEQRKSKAMDQIREIAATAQIVVSFQGGRTSKRRRVALRPGDRYVNPGDISQSYIVGNGKQPTWFVALRDKGRLPPPVVSGPPKDKGALA